ncbi:MAG: DUF4249 family protein [Bacteroidia bacterium]|nr:DUF4249 family protein [Bacteroidia bacterium]
MKSYISILKNSLLVLSLLTLMSCEDRIQVKVDKTDSRITVDAFLNNLRQDQQIRITSTNSYFSGTTTPPVIGAEVSVTDLNTNKKYSFSDKGEGNYVYTLHPSDTMIVTGHSYQLTVRYKSYEYNAMTSAKRSVTIDALYFKYEEAVNSLLGNIPAGLKLKLLAKDQPGPTPDFYWVKLYKNTKFYSRPQNMQLESFGLNNESDGLLFSPDRWKTSGPDGEDVPKTGDIVRLEIHGISREVYDFLSLGAKMINNGGMFAVPSVNLPTNIHPVNENTPEALGFFSVSEVNYKEIVCP